MQGSERKFSIFPAYSKKLPERKISFWQLLGLLFPLFCLDLFDCVGEELNVFGGVCCLFGLLLGELGNHGELYSPL